MANYIVKKGKWEEFFSFGLPDLIFSRIKSHTLSCSMDFPPDKKHDLPISILEISVYNPTAYKSQKVLKAKLWFDKDGKINQLNSEDYLKFSEYSFEEREILSEIGEEIKLTVFRDRTLIIQIKKPSDFSFELIFKIIKKRIKENIPVVENQLVEHLKEDQVKINDYITLELKEGLNKVKCKGKAFWTFIQDDIKRSRLVEPKRAYEEWYKNDYLPHVDDDFKPQRLNFSDVCRIFRQWNNNNLKNLDFSWHFYGHLMGQLHNAGHSEAKIIYNYEIKKRDEKDLKILKIKEKETITQKGIWNDFFDFEIPEQELRALEHQTSTWMQFPYDAEKMLPRSILDITLYEVKNPFDRWLKMQWYLERKNEMREIEYEKSTYFKYWEFLEKKDDILRNLGEEIKLISHLDGSTSISFINPNFIPREIIFPEFKKKVDQIFMRLMSKKNMNTKE